MAEKTKKTTAKPKAKKAEVTLPKNPTRPYGAYVRKMQVSKKEAARLVNAFSFRVESVTPEGCVIVADEAANKLYEASK